MQDANLVLDPRGRAQIPSATTPPMRSSASLSSTLGQGEQQADTLQNPNTQSNHDDAHTAWSAHMRNHKRPETHIENKETIKDAIKPSSNIISGDIWRSVSVADMSDALSDPRSEILSPHFQFAALSSSAQPEPVLAESTLAEPAETQLLGPEGSISQLPRTDLTLPIGITASDTDAVNGYNLDITGQDTLSVLAETRADTNIEGAAIAQDPSNGPERTESRQDLLLTKSDLKITLDNTGNRPNSLVNVVYPIAADDGRQDQGQTPRLDPAIDPETQRLETRLDTNSRVQNVDTKTAAEYIKSFDRLSTNITPQNIDGKSQTPISNTIPAEPPATISHNTSIEINEAQKLGSGEIAGGEIEGDKIETGNIKTGQTGFNNTISVDAVEEAAASDLRTSLTDLARTEDILEDSRVPDIKDNSSADLAKDLYVKTGHAVPASGMASGLTPITDSALALETLQFSLGATQTATPSAQTAATLAVNSLAPIPTSGPNTVAIISQAMLTAKETAKGVTVQLDPPEMGRVYIDFIFEADRQVNIIVKTETLDAQHMLRERSDDFLAMLKEEGLDGATLSFEFHDNQGFEGFDQSFVSETSDSQLEVGENPLNRPLVQHSYSKTTAYTDGLDLRL